MRSWGFSLFEEKFNCYSINAFAKVLMTFDVQFGRPEVIKVFVDGFFVLSCLHWAKKENSFRTN